MIRRSVSAFLLGILATVACGSPGDELEGDPLGTAGAHEHGVAALSLAVDGTELTAELTVPGMSAFGFEHRPTSQEDRATVDRVLDAARARFTEAVALDPARGCRVQASHAAVEAEGEQHADVAHRAAAEEHRHVDDEGVGSGHEGQQGDANEHAAEERHAEQGHAENESEHSELMVRVIFRCDRDPTGSEVGLALPALFPDVERVDLQLLSSERQAGARVAADTRFRL